ncbi:transcriptional regulator [Corynebacterium suranareeae]|uniref:Transcriptional regulator n=1 Tax=Corynebacterium suranareeae TaxID=2506452 RepID=A0A160PTR1_9CORY|nr:TetR family transcriptional regulator [Corynebacterium suranareeae]BAU96441.1 transcriptional regulator [Corynebacterium suranareeae]
MLAIVQLSKESIIGAAVSILSEFGLSDMTMRRVAKQLNVAPGALYWHFKNKQELIDATSRHILAPILGRDDEQQARISAQENCAEMRALMMNMKDGAEVVSAALSSQQLRTELEAIISQSLDVPDEVGAFTLLHFVVGAVLTEQTQLQMHELTAGAESDTEQNSSDVDFEERFNKGVETILAGLEALRHIR